VGSEVRTKEMDARRKRSEEERGALSTARVNAMSFLAACGGPYERN